LARSPSASRIAWRDVHGLILLDKPQGMSSNQALQAVRRLLRAAKGGHTGSLDPLATGMLPLCLGEATKLAGGLLGANKAYVATACLGVNTDTDDAEGRAIQTRPVPTLTIAQVEQALIPLRGRILQHPPVYSALKRDGEAQYARARRGEEVVTQAREVQVHSLHCSRFEPPFLDLQIECGSGTYVRSLVRDLGEALGCGAHVTMLRRTWADPFRGEAMHTLDSLQAMAEDECLASLLPVERALHAWPRAMVGEADAAKLGCGQPCAAAPDLVPGEVGLWLHERGLGLGRVDEQGGLWPKRLFTWACAGA
jgi:tRNA pseudouridine55 synthase